MTGAALIATALKDHKVTTVFGIPGAQNMELFDALAEAGLRVVLPTHELCGAFMADGFARSTGKPAVLVTVPGPGLTNTLTGMAEASLDGVPLVAFFCDIRSNSGQAFQLHEIDQEEAVFPFAKEVLLLDPAEIKAAKGAIVDAFQHAVSGEPGPVAVLVPVDFLSTQVEMPEEFQPIAEFPEAERKEIARAAALLKQARRPVIYAGAGAVHAATQILMIAEAVNAPIATTISGKGLIPEDHPLAVGYGFGPSGSPVAEKAFKKADVLLAVGCKFGEVATGHYGMEFPKKVIHIDINPNHLDRNVKATVSLHADARVALGDILGELGSFKRPEDTALKEQIVKWKEHEERTLANLKPWPDAVNPRKLIAALRTHMAVDAIVTFDSGHHMFFGLAHLKANTQRSFLAPVDYQSMGYAVPAAVGAKLGNLQRQVVACVGDGGFLMTGMELLTAVREEAPIIVVVFNDGALGMIKTLQEQLYKRTVATDLLNPDWEALAKALHVRYYRIEHDGMLDEVLTACFAEGPGPALVDARVSYREVPRFTQGVIKVTRKRMPFAEAWRFGKRRMIRTSWDGLKRLRGKKKK